MVQTKMQYTSYQKPLGRAHANPIMDTRLYEDNFAGFKVTKLTANSLLSLCTLNAMQMRMSIYS